MVSAFRWPGSKTSSGGKIWAALDNARRPSKRQKDLADIARLLEVRPDLRRQTPAEILARLV